MLARLSRTLPRDGYLYEPKWDGFRCLAFRDGDDIDLRSRHDRPLARYFPELVEGLSALAPDRFVLDGEIVLATEAGFDFAALMTRLHPAASRVARLREEMPASYVAFDLLALADDDTREAAFVDRRAALEQLVTTTGGRIVRTPITDSADEADAWLDRFRGGGIDGIVAKERTLTYQAGRRAMVKVKLERTADCVVAGLRLFPDGRLSSLLLGLYDEARSLRHVGVVTSFPHEDRVVLPGVLAPLAVPLEQHPWRGGFLIERSPLGRLKGSAGRWTPEMEHDWVPLRPERVIEAAYDQLDAERFRHAARFRRWRFDRDPASCTIDQVAVAPPELPGVPMPS
jgi:ATP-dependent DNA ligase